MTYAKVQVFIHFDIVSGKCIILVDDDDNFDDDYDFVLEPKDDGISITGNRKGANLSIQEQILSKKRKRNVDSIWINFKKKCVDIRVASFKSM